MMSAEEGCWEGWCKEAKKTSKADGKACED